MAGMLKVSLVGNLGADPEMRPAKSGTNVCNFRVGCSDNRSEKTEWIGAVCFGRLAELAVKHLHKGSQVYVDGRMQTREWSGKDGKVNTSVEVVVDSLVFLGSPGGRSDGGGKAVMPPVVDGPGPLGPDEIPF